MSSWLTVGGVVALVMADVVLVWLALMHVRDGDGAGSTSGPTAVATTPTEPAPLTAGPLLLDAARDGSVVRVARGGCGGASGDTEVASVVEVSTDGGGSFEPVDVGGPLADVLRVSTTSADASFVVGVGPTCSRDLYRPQAGGEAWVSAAGAADVWHLSLATADGVHAPTGRAPTGCEVRSLSALTKSLARVLCSDGQLRGTEDGGATWVTLGVLEAAVDVAYTSPADAWAVAPVADCSAAVLSTTNGGADWQQTACVDVDAEPQAVAAVEGSVLAHAGGRLYVSEDDGQTFSVP